MSPRAAVPLIVLGALVFAFGVVLTLAFRDYSLFGLPLTSGRDVAVSAALALIGMVIVLVGIRAVARERNRRTGQNRGEAPPGET